MAAAEQQQQQTTPPAAGPHEQRQHPRLKLPIGYAAVRVRDEPQRAFHAVGHAYDLSWSGVRFELDEPIPVGQPLEMELTLPGDSSHPVRLRAVCVRHQDPDEAGPARMAAAIVDLHSDVDRQALADYLDQRLAHRKAG